MKNRDFHFRRFSFHRRGVPDRKELSQSLQSCLHISQYGTFSMIGSDDRQRWRGGSCSYLIANANVITLPLKFCFDVLVKSLRYTCEIAARKKSLAQTMTSNSNTPFHKQIIHDVVSFLRNTVGKLHSSELARTTVCFVYSLTLLN